MSVTLKRTLVCSLSFAIAATFLTWLVLGDGTPFHRYFLFHVTLPNFLRLLLSPILLVQLFIRPRDSSVDMVVVMSATFLQWLIVGFVITKLVFRIRGVR
jgi:hypothetical protein